MIGVGTRSAFQTEACPEQARGEGSSEACPEQSRGEEGVQVMPTLHQIEARAIRPALSGTLGVVGVCSIGSEDVPIYSWALLGPTPAQQVA